MGLGRLTGQARARPSADRFKAPTREPSPACVRLSASITGRAVHGSKRVPLGRLGPICMILLRGCRCVQCTAVLHCTALHCALTDNAVVLKKQNSPRPPSDARLPRFWLGTTTELTGPVGSGLAVWPGHHHGERSSAS
jgi:hypothetical protein